MKNAKLIVLSAAFLFFVSQQVLSEDSYARSKDLFNDNISYDIYFSNGERDTTIVRSVEILRFEEIAGKTFVVIRSSGFNLKDQEGFILFDSISAILPDRNFRVNNKKGIKLN